MTGKKFGMLTVEAYSHSNLHGDKVWLCRCDCGNTRECTTNELNRGHVSRCKACMLEYRKEIGKRFHKQIDGERIAVDTEKLYHVWRTMRDRCNNPNNNRYDFYGARGITVCEAWQESYGDFRKWALANGYKDGMSIERINVNGNYEPDNCKMLPMREQPLNRRDTLYIEFEGRKIPLARMIFDLGLDYQKVWHYLRGY